MVVTETFWLPNAGVNLRANHIEASEASNPQIARRVQRSLGRTRQRLSASDPSLPPKASSLLERDPAAAGSCHSAFRTWWQSRRTACSVSVDGGT